MSWHAAQQCEKVTLQTKRDITLGSYSNYWQGSDRSAYLSLRCWLLRFAGSKSRGWSYLRARPIRSIQPLMPERRLEETLEPSERPGSLSSSRLTDSFARLHGTLLHMTRQYSTVRHPRRFSTSPSSSCPSTVIPVQMWPLLDLQF